MRWIRWKYVLPRLVLVLLAIVTVEMGGAMVARKIFVASCQQATGAKVEVDHASASLLRTCVGLDGIALANPRDPLKNLIEADRLVLDLDSASLLRKQAVASRGVLRGVRFGTHRQTSGMLIEVPESSDSDRENWLLGTASTAAQEWLEDVGQQFGDDLLDQLQSVRVSQQLMEQWPARYAELEYRVSALKSEVTELKKQVAAARENPLRHVKFLEELPGKITTIQESLAKLHAEVKHLPNRVDADRRAIDAARQHDEQLIREKLQLDQIEAAALTTYLVSEQVARPVGEIIRWVRWARETLGTGAEAQRPVRIRGVDVLFADCQQLPNLLVRSLDLKGTARIGGQPVELSGTVTDLTTDPKIHGEPVRIRITTTGSLPMQLQATIDRTGDAPRDQLLVDCRDVLLPRMKLGQPNALEIAVGPSTGSLNVSLLLEGDMILGDIQLVQKSVEISPKVSPKLARWQVDSLLKDSLSKLNSIATHVTLTGRLDAPDLQLWSNLGPAVSEAMTHALATAVESKSQDLLASSSRHVAQQLDELDEQVNRQVARLLPSIESPTQELANLTKEFTQGNGLSLEQIGGRLPTDSLFR